MNSATLCATRTRSTRPGSTACCAPMRSAESSRCKPARRARPRRRCCSGAELKQKGKSAGATGWIVKPFNPEVLLDTLKKVLD